MRCNIPQTRERQWGKNFSAFEKTVSSFTIRIHSAPQAGPLHDVFNNSQTNVPGFSTQLHLRSLSALSQEFKVNKNDKEDETIHTGARTGRQSDSAEHLIDCLIVSTGTQGIPYLLASRVFLKKKCFTVIPSWEEQRSGIQELSLQRESCDKKFYVSWETVIGDFLNGDVSCVQFSLLEITSKQKIKREI